MRRPFDYNFRVNGKPMLAPNAGVGFSYSDLDSDDSGRDEAGYMHRSVARYKVGTWSFEYSSLTKEEVQYMESLFEDVPDFEFKHPVRPGSDRLVTTRCYRSKYGISWVNENTGDWRNYKFNIIEC